jgi:hypothetical protein
MCHCRCRSVIRYEMTGFAASSSALNVLLCLCNHFCTGTSVLAMHAACALWLWLQPAPAHSSIAALSWQALMAYTATHMGHIWRTHVCIHSESLRVLGIKVCIMPSWLAVAATCIECGQRLCRFCCVCFKQGMAWHASLQHQCGRRGPSLSSAGWRQQCMSARHVL